MAKRGASPIDDTLRIVGDRWSILIVRAGLRGIRRFDDLCSDLGIARPILTERLRRLVAHGVMEKVPYSEHPRRYEYRLTDAGIALSPVLVALVRWTEEYGTSEATGAALVHAPCGSELEQAFWCRTCGTTFGPHAIRGGNRNHDEHDDTEADASSDTPT